MAKYAQKKKETDIRSAVLYKLPKALFSFEKWKVFGTVALSFVCDKYYSIME